MFFKSLFWVVFLSDIIQSAVCGDESGDKVTESLIRALFPHAPNAKLNYKFAKLVTPNSSRSKREIRPVEFHIEDKVIKLCVTPVNHDALPSGLPVWFVESDLHAEGNHTYKKLDKEQSYLDGIFYEDVANKAILYGYYRSGNIFYDGVIGEGSEQKIIRAIPEQWYDLKGVGSNNHLIFESNGKNMDNNINPQIGDTQYFEHVPKLAEPLNTLHPKLLLVVEYNFFKLHKENVPNIIKYLSIFWNAVNLKYREISSPKVEISITGIVIAKDNASLAFIQRAVNPEDVESLNYIQLIAEGSQYFKNQFEKKANYSNYDSAVVITTLRAGSVAGSAYVAAICDKNVIYIRDDDGAFEKIPVANHELGHSLGLTHDDLNIAQPPHNTTVLSPVFHTVSEFYWSKHSLAELKAFATTTKAKCLESAYRHK